MIPTFRFKLAHNDGEVLSFPGIHGLVQFLAETLPPNPDPAGCVLTWPNGRAAALLRYKRGLYYIVTDASLKRVLAQADKWR